MIRFSHLSLLLLVGSGSVVVSQANEGGTLVGFDLKTLPTALPEALSDFTAVLDNANRKAYLAGGCNSPDGNRFIEDYGSFACESISNKLYIFDLESLDFTETTEPMPVMRYRHASVLANNQVWLVGGRDLDDNLISSVDVYDIATGSWKTHGDLDEDHVTSDLAGFAAPDGALAYFVGGYDLNYTALDSVFAIDPVATASSGFLSVSAVSPLPTPRGDLSAVSLLTSEGVAYALVTGGFSHENGFCEPLAATEYYNFDEGSWRVADDLQVARSDKALVVLDDVVYAMGGERQIANICLGAEPEPGEETVPLQDVEYWDAATDEWVKLEDLPRHRFRFAAIGYENKVYAFGGQEAFSEDCKCFRTTNEVTVYSEVFEGDGMSNGDSGAVYTSGFVGILTMLFGVVSLLA